MQLLNKLERQFGKYAVPNVTLILIAAQVVVYVMTFTRRELLNGMYLVPNLVLQGQVWRLISFLLVPPVNHPIFAFFFWYLFYLMGNSLENYWGAFRYNVYLLIGYVATVAASFLLPSAVSSNAFLQASVFLAFAFLNPDFLLYIFFILPVKIKWLALITWITYGYILLFGSWISRYLILASILNYLFFFGSDIRERLRTGRRHMSSQAKGFGRQELKQQAFHRCAVCGITDLTHPDMEFRYCMECAGSPGYCKEHLQSHEHVR